MNEIEKYIDVTFIGIIAIIGIPVFLILSIFALIGYITCKILKMSPDEIRYFDYE